MQKNKIIISPLPKKKIKKYINLYQSKINSNITVQNLIGASLTTIKNEMEAHEQNIETYIFGRTKKSKPLIKKRFTCPIQ